MTSKNAKPIIHQFACHFDQAWAYLIGVVGVWGIRLTLFWLLIFRSKYASNFELEFGVGPATIRFSRPP
jgi:hypothetical protein